MKKLPVLLSILTLSSVMPMNVVNALETEEEQGVMVEMGERVTTELPAVHEFDSRVNIQVIKPREGLVEIEVMSPMGEQLQVQRVWLATLDYENGWTEAEVDEALDNWTALEADWTLVTKEEPIPEASPYYSYTMIPLTIGETSSRYDLMAVNLLDVLYYAVEFKDLENEAAGTFWVRGKVNYRGCAHAQRFENWQTGTCIAMIDRDAGTTKYWAEESTEDEKVVTWEEEWRLVLAGRLGEIGAALDGLAVIPDLSRETLTQSLANEGERLTKIEALLAKATGVKEEVAKARKLRERMAKMLNGSTEGTGNGSSSGVGLGVSDGSGSGSLSGSGLESETGDVSSTDSDDCVGSSAGSEDAVGNLSSPDFGGLVVVNSSVEHGSEEIVAGADDGVDGLEDVSEIKAPEEEVEVPKLGGAKVDRGGWIWWVMRISGALALFLVVAMKRKQRK